MREPRRTALIFGCAVLCTSFWISAAPPAGRAEATGFQAVDAKRAAPEHREDERETLVEP